MPHKRQYVGVQDHVGDPSKCAGESYTVTVQSVSGPPLLLFRPCLTERPPGLVGASLTAGSLPVIFLCDTLSPLALCVAVSVCPPGSLL